MWGKEPQLEFVNYRFKQLLETNKLEVQPRKIHLPNDHLLIKQGTSAEYCYLLLEGKVSIELESNSFYLHRLACVEAEQFLGELALIEKGKHTCNVRVIDGSAELLEIRGNSLMKAMLYDVELVFELFGLVCDRCKKINLLLGLTLDGINAIKSKDKMTLEKTCQKLISINNDFSDIALQLSQLYEN